MRFIFSIRFTAAFLLVQLASTAIAQTPDTTAVLPEVVVKAFEQVRKQKDLAAAVSVIGQATLERFSPASVVQAVNTAPGVRMEERSPGSYRFNIRGSSLRSPFGVRNIKVYFNDLPITDPGGATFLNQLGYYNFHSVEIIKGPGSSLYGAGTGGALLIESAPPQDSTGFVAEYTAGSFGLHNVYASGTAASNNFKSRIGFQHQQSDGYRDHSRLQRAVLTWTGLAQLGENTQLKTTFLYGDLFYQTPGALTRAEFEKDPQAARPGNTAFPGAAAAQASISQKQVIAGASIAQKLSPSLNLKTVAYGMFTDLRNPAIQNYGHNSEPHGGLRTTFDWSKKRGNAQLWVVAGAELQAGWPSVNIHKNSSGRADSLRSSDAIRNRQALFFAQAAWENPHWQVVAGTGLSFLDVSVERFSPAATGPQQRRFNNGAAPRFTVLKKFKVLNAYAGVAKGFSPPTTAELLPTGGAINLGLNAESGWNYEAGLKGTVLRRLYVDVNAFRFSLNNTIVLRRTAGGGDFYVNAGSTAQWGVETYLSSPLLYRLPRWRKSLFWASHTWHRFRYGSFKQLDNDYSGNRMPATPLHTISTGINFIAESGWLATVHYYAAGAIPLNDANTEFANAYHLLGARVGYQKKVHNIHLKLVAGAENLLNQTYSLGNDINGFGGRYFNAAAGQNYFASLTVERR